MTGRRNFRWRRRRSLHCGPRPSPAPSRLPFIQPPIQSAETAAASSIPPPAMAQLADPHRPAPREPTGGPAALPCSHKPRADRAARDREAFWGRSWHRRIARHSHRLIHRRWKRLRARDHLGGNGGYGNDDATGENVLYHLLQRLALSGSTSGSLTLEQDAYAGDAGGSTIPAGGPRGMQLPISSPRIASAHKPALALPRRLRRRKHGSNASGGCASIAIVNLTSNTSGQLEGTAASNYYGGGSGYSGRSSTGRDFSQWRRRQHLDGHGFRYRKRGIRRLFERLFNRRKRWRRREHRHGQRGCRRKIDRQCHRLQRRRRERNDPRTVRHRHPWSCRDQGTPLPERERRLGRPEKVGYRPLHGRGNV